ncbi:unannotated protein [freshwater metagenome]|uniref:Unannotated protein n=1 Tax=freshwater metagenome TaxID=449393 RepID=A0A6J6P2X7_9ZZZZ
MATFGSDNSKRKVFPFWASTDCASFPFTNKSKAAGRLFSTKPDIITLEIKRFNLISLALVRKRSRTPDGVRAV